MKSNNNIITDPDFGNLSFVLDTDDPLSSFWQCEWTFPVTGTVILISLPGGKEGPRPEARQFYLSLPSRFDRITTIIQPQLEDFVSRQMHQSLPKNIFTVLKLLEFELMIPQGRPLEWDMTFQTLGDRRSTITIPFIGNTPQEAEIWIDPDKTPTVASKDLRPEFRTAFASCRRRTRIYFSGAIIGILAGIFVMVTRDVLTIEGLFVVCSLTGAALLYFSPKLLCPACQHDIFTTELYCPECGGFPLKQVRDTFQHGGARRSVIVHECDRCNKQLRRGSRHNYKTHYCSHCRAYLDELGQ